MVAACDVVTTGPTVKIVYPANGATIGYGGTTIKATATDNKGVIEVAFLDGSTTIGEDTSAVADTFSISWTSGAAGSHTLKAVATNQDGKTAEHSITVTVSAGNAIHHSGRIDTNEVWYPTGNPHILDADVYTGDNVTLTIMPGCYVQFSADVELYTGYSNPGSIIAVGTADSMITFTSLSDTVPGFWDNIGFHSNTISTARMSYCKAEFGGKTASDHGTIQVSGCNIKFDHNTVRRSGDYGVRVESNGYFADFSNNTITTSGEYPVGIEADKVRTLGTGNVLTGNTKDGILVDGENVATTGTWLNHGVPYVIADDVNIADATANPVITIAAGTTVKMTPHTEFYVGYSNPGGLIADGTPIEMITFTSSVNPPSAGDWDRISFHGNSISSQCKLKNCKVEYAGYDGRGNIYIKDCTPEVTGDSIGHSSEYGIYLDGSTYPDPTQLQADNTFYDNASGDIRVPPK